MNMISAHGLKSKTILLPLMGGDTQGVSAPREAAEQEKQHESARTCTHALVVKTVMLANPYSRVGYTVSYSELWLHLVHVQQG